MTTTTDNGYDAWLKQELRGLIDLLELSAMIGLEAPPELFAFLAERGLNTLADVRAAGGLTQLVEERPADAEALNAIGIHARMAALIPDVEVRRRLIRPLENQTTRNVDPRLEQQRDRIDP